MRVSVCVCVWVGVGVGVGVGGGGGLHMTAVFGKALFRSIRAIPLISGYTAASTRDSVWILGL